MWDDGSLHLGVSCDMATLTTDPTFGVATAPR